MELPPNCNAFFIEWLDPYRKETLQQYAKRIASAIDTSSPFVLIGLSFGGMLATEVLEYVRPQKTILISSVACRNEIPLLYRLAGITRLNRILPAKAANRSHFITYWLLGLTNKKDKGLLQQILTDTNTRFSKWAVNEIVNWKRNTVPANIIRIHGTKDRVLPINHFQPQYIIQDGGHFMVANRAAEVSAVLKTIIDE